MRALAHQQVFKKRYCSNAMHFTSEEHARSKSSAGVTFSGADGFKRLNGGPGDVSEMERCQQSVQAISSGDVNLDEGLELEQVTAISQIRVTNDVQMEFESNTAHMHEQYIEKGW